MKKCFVVLTIATIVSVESSCVSKPLALAPVGPDATIRTLPMSAGHLQVFSATEKSIPFGSDDPTFFNLHTGYEIYDDAGNKIKFVANHASNMDESPDTVTLPPGNYRIEAKSTWCGEASVPVVIKKGKTTSVHLDNNWFPNSHTNPSQFVYLPNGDAVGCRASANP